jgi:hypothetical protein
MNAILSGIAEVEFVKVMHLGTTKEMWDKLISSYEGNEKGKGCQSFKPTEYNLNS